MGRNAMEGGMSECDVVGWASARETWGSARETFEGCGEKGWN